MSTRPSLLVLLGIVGAAGAAWWVLTPAAAPTEEPAEARPPVAPRARPHRVYRPSTSVEAPTPREADPVAPRPAPRAVDPWVKEQVAATTSAHLQVAEERAQTFLQDLFTNGALTDQALLETTGIVEEMGEDLDRIAAELEAGSLDGPEAARRVRERQQEAYDEVMQRAPPTLAVPLLRVFAAPDAMEPDPDPGR